MSQITTVEYKLPEQVESLKTPWFFWLPERVLTTRTWYAAVLRKMRRSYMAALHPGYVRASIEAKRQGDCTRCGACCSLVYKCPFLGVDSNNLHFCRIYGELRPQSCRNYPFDRIDADVEQCGFKFN